MTYYLARDINSARHNSPES